MIHSVPVSDDRRLAQRTPLKRPAVLRFGDQIVDIEVNDLTRDGCRITTTLDLPPFGDVSIGIGGVGHTPARVVWRNNRNYGCAFERRLPQDAVSASQLDNIAQFTAAGVPCPPLTSDEVKYSYRARVAIISGLAGFLWSAIIGLAWLV